MEQKGERSCSSGSMIMDKIECKAACTELNIGIFGSALKGGKACYKAGRGKCRQNGHHGPEASLLCTNDIGM